MTASLSPVRLAGRTLSRTNHICAFFNSPDEQNKVLMPFYKDGYDQGEKLFHIVDSGLHAAHRCACQQGGIDVDTAEASGQLEIHDWEETYLKDGYFDGDRQIRIVPRSRMVQRPPVGHRCVDVAEVAVSRAVRLSWRASTDAHITLWLSA